MTSAQPDPTAQQKAIEAYWATARQRAKVAGLEWLTGTESSAALTPPAGPLGATAQQADELLGLVLRGAKTATSSAAEVYEIEGIAPPVAGDLSIILDGQGRPRALVATTSVQIRPFDEVDAEHAAAEGEGDLSLAHWRQVHREFFSAELAQVGREFTPRSAVVLETIRLLDPRRGKGRPQSR